MTVTATGSLLTGAVVASGLGGAPVMASGALLTGALIASGIGGAPIMVSGGGVAGAIMAAGVFPYLSVPTAGAGAYATFSPPKNPQWPLDTPIKPRLLEPQFGPGYPSFAPDGVNTMLRSVTLKFAPLIQGDFTAIDSFISANMAQPFYYTLPDETNPRLWIYISRVRRVLSTVWEYELSLEEQPIL
jgi:phage-related protein